MALSSLAVLPEAARLFGRAPAYELDQFAPIALFTADPTLLVVPASAPWRTLEEFIAAAKARPGAISYSSAGNYSALHVPMAMLTTAAGLDMLHVPFQGGAPALTALLGGQVQALATGPGPAAPHLREGRLRALACWGGAAPARVPRGADPDRARLPGGRVLHLDRHLRARRHAGAGARGAARGDGGRGRGP